MTSKEFMMFAKLMLHFIENEELEKLKEILQNMKNPAPKSGAEFLQNMKGAIYA